MKHLSDDFLLEKVKDLARRERELLTELLRYLHEVETRGLHLDRAYPSMFAFCTRYLGYSEMEAYTRIQAMRLLYAVPEVETKLQTGTLTLSNAAAAQCFFRREDRRRRKLNSAPLTSEKKREIVLSLENLSARECEQSLRDAFTSTEPPPREKTVGLAGDRFLIQFVADRALMEKMDRARSILSHRGVENRYDLLFSVTFDFLLKKLDPLSKNAAPFLGTSQGTQHQKTH